MGIVSTVLLAGAARAAVVNVASQAGIADTFRTFSVNPADFNRDGLDDFLYVRHVGNEGVDGVPFSTLWRNTGGSFANHATEALGRTDKHGCAWGDANVDGRLDLFCAVGFTQASKNELFIQNADGSFTNRTRAWGLTLNTHGRYRYATFIHANNDLRPDIYVARYTGSCYCDRNEDGVIDYAGDTWPNELWINQGTTYRHAPEFGLDVAIGAKKDNATCAQAVDYDKDGDEDLLVCGGNQLRLYNNQSGTGFVDVSAQKGISGNAADARLVDLNGDGNRDLVRLNPGQLNVRYGNGTGGFGGAVTLATMTAGEALAFGRFDPGTTLDIYALGSRGKAKNDQVDKLLLNNGGGSFTTQVIPATSGAGDDVAALDYDNNGSADFVVTNGDRHRFGPVQLFTWR
jgi:hypothetical protein